MKIYLVIGESGEIDDYNSWTVCAYTDMEKAVEHALNAKTRVDEIQRINRNPKSKYHTDKNGIFSIKQLNTENEYDHNTNNYNSIYECFYSVEEMELYD